MKGTVIPVSRQALHKVEKPLVVEKHLGHDVIGTGIHLLFEVT